MKEGKKVCLKCGEPMKIMHHTDISPNIHMWEQTDYMFKRIKKWIKIINERYCGYPFGEMQCPYCIDSICTFPSDNCYFENQPIKKNKG